MSSWHSYPSIYNLGHRAVQALFSVEVDIEEKIDGSQFSFGIFEDTSNPTNKISHEFGWYDVELKVRSKGAVMEPDAPERMFSLAVKSVKERLHLLHPGWTYRGEYLQKPKHNTLAYDRVPEGHIIIFDINTGEETYLAYEEKAVEAQRIGLEVVPRLFSGYIRTAEELRQHLSTPSILGGQTVEGVVVKQIGPEYLYGLDHKVLIGKFVSEAFKEAHGVAWKESNPSTGDILVQLGKQYCHPGRWLKAIQHLREAGQLEDSPKDIGKLLIEIQKDLGKEEKEEIEKRLWKWAWPHVSRATTRGFPEFYKDYLLKRQFEESAPADGSVPESGNGHTDHNSGTGGDIDSVVS